MNKWKLEISLKINSSYIKVCACVSACLGRGRVHETPPPLLFHEPWYKKYKLQCSITVFQNWLQHSTFPRKRVRVHKIVLTENVLVAKLVPNAKTVNISTNISGVVHATVIQHLKINCCWYIIVVEMIERGNFLLHLSILLTCSRIVIVYLRNLF